MALSQHSVLCLLLLFLLYLLESRYFAATYESRNAVLSVQQCVLNQSFNFFELTSFKIQVFYESLVNELNFILNKSNGKIKA